MTVSKTRIRLIYILATGVSVLIFCVWFFSKISADMKRSMKYALIDSMSFSYKPVTDYNKNFNFAKGTDFKIATFSKTRQPIEEFLYQDSYFFLYELPVKSKKNLPEILKIKQREISPSLDSGYYDLLSTSRSSIHSSYDILYRVGKPDSGKEINFNLSDGSFKVLKNNDTSYSCYLNLGSFSINYNNSGIVDFYGKKQSNAKMSRLPVEIIFEKKKDHYYMLLMIKIDR